MAAEGNALRQMDSLSVVIGSRRAWRAAGGLVVAGLLVIVSLTGGSASAATFKLYTTRSYYVENDDLATWNEAGCAQAAEDVAFYANKGTVILDFGGQVGNRKETEDTERKMNFTNAEIEKVTEAYARGYTECVGEDIEDSEAVIIGTNSSKEAVTKAGGKAWAEVVKTVATHVLESPLESSIISIWGGDDMEVEYSTGSSALAWAKGYSETTESPEVDYGSADGCSRSTHGKGHKCVVEHGHSGWTQEVEYKVSWEIRGDNPLPEIYYNTDASEEGPVNAEQWAQIDLFGKGAMRFLGSLSEGGFAGSDTAGESYFQLGETLEKDGLNDEHPYSTEI